MTSLVLAAALFATPEPPELRYTPRQTTTLLDFAIGTGRVLTRPLMPRTADAWVIVPAAVATAALLQFDVPIHREIRDGLPDPVVAGQEFSYWGSYLGDGVVDVAIFAAIGVIGGRKGERVAVAGLQALAATAIASRALKLVFRVERPSYDPERQHLFSERWQADAFPSGHAMAAFATAAVIGEEYPLIAPIVYALATYVAVARVQQSTHWASDVVVGAALGLLFGWEAVALNREVRIAPFATRGGGGAAISGTAF